MPVPDLLPAPGGAPLRLLLCGINPSVTSGTTGLHFARPGNRLWRTLHEAGLTARELAPADTAELLAAGIGITNLVARVSARADELSTQELRDGVRRLTRTTRRVAPVYLAVLGVTAYRTAFRRPGAAVGPQPDHTVGGVPVWLLPNPSGRAASYQQPALTAAYGELRTALERAEGRPRARRGRP